MEYRFYKTEEGDWFIDLPEWPYEKEELQMVFGADTMLDTLAKGRKEISLMISLLQKDSTDVLTLNYKVPRITGSGAYYKWNELDVWLCDVTKFIFKKFPRNIYFKVLSNG